VDKISNGKKKIKSSFAKGGRGSGPYGKKLDGSSPRKTGMILSQQHTHNKNGGNPHGEGGLGKEGEGVFSTGIMAWSS